LIVDDHRMFAESLMRLLDDEADFERVEIAASVADARRMAAELQPDVALVDYLLPDGDGAAAAVELRALVPGMKVILLSGARDDDLLRCAVDAGCVGLFTKDRTATELVDALRAAGAGETLFARSSLVRLLRQPDPVATPPSELTPREREILELLVEGRSNADIAARLAMSVNTVRNHNQAILRKLGVRSRLEAAAEAVRTGLVAPPRPGP
jgi:DNA-binding NarL/FixJ family response regulator